METAETNEAKPHLQRRFGLLQATALNMSNMIGVGPFITIPVLMSALNGPQSMLGWAVALIICMADGLIWSELGAAFPGSGGSYVFLREAFGAQRWGRLMAFLFIWQFIFSGPLEIASGYIGFSNYLGYVWPNRSAFASNFFIVGMGLVTIFLLYRQITSIGKITIALWIGTLLTTFIVIALGAFRFDPNIAFDFPPNAFKFSVGFLSGLGTAAAVGIYDYLGYYDVCYIGDEVKDPGRTIPRSILISLFSVAIIYICMNLSIVGVVPWKEFVPADGNRKADFIVSIFVERILGPKAAVAFTALVLWTAFGSVFALLLGYSRIPYAAALDGYFFKVFGKLHPTKNFPYVSLIVIGLLAIFCSFFKLDEVISALITTRILVQFIGQIGAVFAIRKRYPASRLPFRMWLYPIPCFVALVGWIFVFVTTKWPIIVGGLGSLLAGVIAFLIWSSHTRRWPFGSPVEART